MIDSALKKYRTLCSKEDEIKRLNEKIRNIKTDIQVLLKGIREDVGETFFVDDVAYEIKEEMGNLSLNHICDAISLHVLTDRRGLVD